MNLLIRILLWIGAISPNSTYTTNEIHSLESTYQPIISVIESNPITSALVLEEEQNNVIAVFIIDPAQD